MADPGTNYTDNKQEQIERRLVKIYSEAQRDIKKQLSEHTAKFKATDRLKRQQLKEGKITQAEYNAWKQGQVFTGDRWREKLDSVTSSIHHANVMANGIVNGERRAVFGENATYQAYQLEHDAGMNLSFTVYDSGAVTRLLSGHPELLKRRMIDGKADRAWNKAIIANTIAKNIITGASIDKIAQEIAQKTALSNEKASVRYARTAMTGAQNAGRIAAMNDALDMGIKVKKLWIATLDERTRSAHAELDGKTAEVNEDFHNSLGAIGFPGDPKASDANVWNCRCTLGYEYEKYPSYGDRRDNISGELIEDMSYAEWKTTKTAGVFDQFNAAKQMYHNMQRAILNTDANHVFKGIWKDDVTYADYSAKAASIGAKRAYFQNKIDQCLAAGNTAEAESFQKLLDELELFASNGASSEMLLQERDKALKEVEKIYKQAVKDTAPPTSGPFGSDAYTQARKDAALWAKSAREVDDALREQTGNVWRKATDKERDAIFEYTQSYHKYNEPLRGIEYGSNEYKGIGNTDLNARYANNGERLDSMTDIIDKSTYTQDVWLQRGCGYGGMDKFFQCSESLLRDGTQQELEAELLGKAVTEYGFMSCGSMKGKGFASNSIMMNVYAPSGTKMMYVEPFSAFGNGDGSSWDGKSGQSTFGYELETILQQGTQMRVTKVERSWDGKIYVDLEVIDQSTQQRWQK